ncbi:cytokine receptor domeless [Biomphalaria pfeifferi]|uniref:Cytokine receptor domeless n=1 Tax=Biomphalaria pfeifferi TaxID=112525 RepID=A0AAD8CAM0_BIOPF|nr:cytokine receptor domeless [Biomphalaria pfeifferi]
MEKKTFFVFVIFSTCLPPSEQSEFTDKYIYVGHKLKLKCNIPTKYKNCSSELLMFRKERPFQIYTETSYEDISNASIEYKSSSVTLEYPNASIHDTGIYQCVLNFCVDQNITIKQFDVKIQYKPVNVINFTCQLIDWDKYLFCSWKYPVQYNWELKDTKIECHFKTDSPSKAKLSCSNLTVNNCTLSNYGGSDYYDFEILVKNTKTNYTSYSMYNIETDQVVKPSAVKRMNFSKSTKNDCFNVSWIYDYYDFPLFEKFELRHQGPNDKDFKVIYVNQRAWEEVCNMKPYTIHNFTVISHASTSNLTSDPIYSFYETPQKAPTLGPQTVNGSYTTDQCKNNSRSVTVYWKRVEPNARNGKITHYIVRHGKTARTVGPNTYQTSIEIPCYTLEFIEIAAATIAGQSVKPTILSIAPIDFKVPSRVAESLAIEETSYLATWEPDAVRQSVNYTIFWLDDPLDDCHGKELHWKHMEQNVNSFLIPYNQSHIKVGIASTHNTTSPIFWTECIYNVNASLDAPTFEVSVAKESVTVTWQKMPCSKKYNYKVTSYVVVYCLVTDCHDTKIVSTLSSYTLKNLQVDRSYNISMCVQVGNRTGPLSQWKTFMTHEYRNDEISILERTVPLVGIVLVFPLIYALFWCIRLNWRGRQKAKKLMKTDEDSMTDLISEHSSGEDYKSLRSIRHHDPQIDVSKPLILSLHAPKHEGLMSEESQPSHTSLVEDLLNSINSPTSCLPTADPTPSYSVISSTSFDRIQWEKELQKRQNLTNFIMRDLETNLKPSCKGNEQFDKMDYIVNERDISSDKHGVIGHQTGSSTDEKLNDSIKFGVYNDCPTQHYEIRNEKDIMESSQFTPDNFDYSDASCVSMTCGQSCVELEVQSLPKADICHADACKDYVTFTEQDILFSQTSTDSESTNRDTCNAYIEAETPETRPLNHDASCIDCTDYMRQTEVTLLTTSSEHSENNMNNDPVNTREIVIALLNKQNSAVNLIKHTPPVNKLSQLENCSFDELPNLDQFIKPEKLHKVNSEQFDEVPNLDQFIKFDKSHQVNNTQLDEVPNLDQFIKFDKSHQVNNTQFDKAPNLDQFIKPEKLHKVNSEQFDEVPNLDQFIKFDKSHQVNNTQLDEAPNLDHFIKPDKLHKVNSEQFDEAPNLDQFIKFDKSHQVNNEQFDEAPNLDQFIKLDKSHQVSNTQLDEAPNLDHFIKPDKLHQINNTQFGEVPNMDQSLSTNEFNNPENSSFIITNAGQYASSNELNQSDYKSHNFTLTQVPANRIHIISSIE